MIENKFGVITNWCVYENVDGVKKWLNFDEVVDLLNQFQKENEQLISEIQTQKQIIAKQEMKLAEYNNQINVSTQ